MLSDQEYYAHHIENPDTVLTSIVIDGITHHNIGITSAIIELGAGLEDLLHALKHMYPRPTLDELITSYVEKIDKLAGDIRNATISPGCLIDQEYLAAYNDVILWRDLNYDAEKVPESIKEWQRIGGFDMPLEAANNLTATRNNWVDLLFTIRSIRLEGKRKVRAATEDTIDTIGEHYLAKLKELLP